MNYGTPVIFKLYTWTPFTNLSFLFCRQSFGSLMDYCQRTLTIQKHERSLPCRECGKSVHCGRRGGLISFKIIDHACHHFGKKLFSCRQCNHAVIRPSSMKWHVRNIHNVKNSTLDHYNDRTLNYHEDLMAMIKRCFATSSSTKKKPDTYLVEEKPTPSLAKINKSSEVNVLIAFLFAWLLTVCTIRRRGDFTEAYFMNVLPGLP